MSRRAKIVCTLGPATSSPGQIAALVAAGMDVARLNMSHGDRGAHRAAYDAVREAGDASGRSVGVLVDLQGPKIRLGRFASGPVTLAAGQDFTITGENVPGDQDEVSVSYPGLAGDVRPGTRLLVDDGRVVLEVTSVHRPRVRTQVVVGGRVSDHKGLNLPGVRVSVPALTSKDAEDLRWALALRADMIALSFVQGPDDAEPARKIMKEMGVRLPLIAKVEKPQAVAALREVVAAFDGIMVAVETWAWSSRWNRCPWCKNVRSGSRGRRRSPLSWPPRCSSRWSARRGRPAPRCPMWPTRCSTARMRSCSPQRPASARTR
jgi:pyruvate kinase